MHFRLFLLLIKVHCRQLILVLGNQPLVLPNIGIEVFHAVIVHVVPTSLIVSLVQRATAAMKTEERVHIIAPLRPAMALLSVGRPHVTIDLVLWLHHRARLLRLIFRVHRWLPGLCQWRPRRSHLA